MKKEIKKMKRGHMLHIPIFSPDSFNNSVFEELLKKAKYLGVPVEKLRYKREIYYFKMKGIKDEGWEDVSEITYIK